MTLQSGSPSALIDAPPHVQIRGLEAKQEAVLHSEWKGFGGTVWASDVAVTADAAGAVDLAGVDGMKFVWAMGPTGPDAHDANVFSPPLEGVTNLAMTLRVKGKTVARSKLARRVIPDSVRVRDLTVDHDGVAGVLLTPRVSKRRPGVLLLGGAEGGVGMIDAAGLLAAHGYPTLALAYFDAPGLPRQLSNIPLEYLRRGLVLLAHRSRVDPGRILVLGSSRGGEAALLLASTYPRLVHAVIALVPSSEVNESPTDHGAPAWTYRGKTLPLEPIEVERIRGAILTAGGGEDAVWPSTIDTDQIEQRLNEHVFRYPHRRLTYPLAGHDIGLAIPYLPQPDPVHFGGTPRAGFKAKADLWPQILDFVETS